VLETGTYLKRENQAGFRDAIGPDPRHQRANPPSVFGTKHLTKDPERRWRERPRHSRVCDFRRPGHVQPIRSLVPGRAGLCECSVLGWKYLQPLCSFIAENGLAHAHGADRRGFTPTPIASGVSGSADISGRSCRRKDDAFRVHAQSGHSQSRRVRAAEAGNSSRAQTRR
jgi:hypothetical protein